MKEQRGINIHNEKILSDIIAVKIKKQLKKKETYVQDLINNLDTKIKLR
jgi:tetrahydromethanopterin S-methyltransferase subunit B